jgi:sarcosine oxidase
MGAWIPKLLGDRYEQLFRVYRQTLCWFALTRNHARYASERFPVFIWITGNQPSDMMYGFPAVDGSQGGIKIATEQYERTVDPDSVPREVYDRETAALYNNYVAPRFPDVSARTLRTATCLYTVTPDAKFVIDTFPGSERVSFASACSGHGFKHSAAIGEALVRDALAETPLVDLSAFRLERFEAAGGSFRG